MSRNRDQSKSSKKIVPKSQNPNPIPTLSNSLRQSHAATAVSTSATAAAAAGTFVKYLPHDEAVAAGLGADQGGLDPVESQQVVDLLNTELSRLLRLSPRDFWREVATDTSLHEFVDTFLKFRSRWYDFPHRGAKGIVAGVIVGELELSRRVFMLLYRISSNKDPGARAADALSAKDHEVLLQEKRLLDLPKLLDICAIYGHENEELTRLLIGNALKAQPRIHDNLTAVVSHFMGIIHTMHQRCISSLEVLFSSGSCEDCDTSALYADFLEVMDFINDAIVSMDALVSAYKPTALFFSFPIEMSYGNEELLSTLAKLHDTLLPTLWQGFQIMLTGGDEGLKSNITVSLKMLSTRIVKFGWKLLDTCYLCDEVFDDSLPIPAVTKIFPAKVEDPVIRAYILVQTFKDISGVLLYAQENQSSDSFLQNLDRKYHIMTKLQGLQNTGWMCMDDEQLQYLSGIMKSFPKSTIKEPSAVPIPVGSHKVQMDEDAAVMESKISQIKDLFPDYGNGYLAACLEVYNQNPEEVIQRILEGTLHQDLQRLDISLETMPPPKSAATITTKDKGKGKLVEPLTLTLASPANSTTTPIMARERQIVVPPVSSSSSSTIGRFVRKSDDVPDYTLDSKDAARTASLISQYEYEDEYDDSFDDLGFSVAESGVEENEMISEKINTNFGKPTQAQGEVIYGLGHGSNIPTGTNKKWGSRQKPQFYVKDGKNYSYWVEGSVAVANSNEASLVTQAQGELIYGLGRGGNIPIGAIKKLTERQEQNNQSDETEMEDRGNARNPRGRGRRGGGRISQTHEEQDGQSDKTEMEDRGNTRNPRGMGRRGGGRISQTHEEQDSQSDKTEMEDRGNTRNPRGRGRRGGGGRIRQTHEEQDNEVDGSEMEGRANAGNVRGRGRRGRGSDHNRKNIAMNKHFSGLSGC